MKTSILVNVILAVAWLACAAAMVTAAVRMNRRVQRPWLRVRPARVVVQLRPQAFPAPPEVIKVIKPPQLRAIRGGATSEREG